MLRWLLENVGVKWAVRMNGVPQKQETIGERHRLLTGSPAQVKAAQNKALEELKRVGAEHSSRKWWAFEGFSSVDCLFETNDMVLLIEGKRSDVLSPATEWYPARNQLARNLEVAQCRAKEKQFGVLLIVENEFKIAASDVEKGWPHLDLREREELWKHYLGMLTWPVVCAATGLSQSVLSPNVDEAMTNLREEKLI